MGSHWWGHASRKKERSSSIMPLQRCSRIFRPLGSARIHAQSRRDSLSRLAFGNAFMGCGLESTFGSATKRRGALTIMPCLTTAELRISVSLRFRRPASMPRLFISTYFIFSRRGEPSQGTVSRKCVYVCAMSRKLTRPKPGCEKGLRAKLSPLSPAPGIGTRDHTAPSAMKHMDPPEVRSKLC